MSKPNTSLFGVFMIPLFLCTQCLAVTSVIIRQNSSDDLLKGTTDGTIVNSLGTIRLAPQTETLDFGDLLEEVWTINALTTDNAGTIYAGTSPNGKIFKYRDGRAELIYPKGKFKTEDDNVNEHVFALAFDVAGRLLAGVSGDKGKLIRFGPATETLFENDQVNYIFAVVLDKKNNIYIGTGPTGQIWQIDPFGQNPTLVCALKDKNILSLTLSPDGLLYAGTDTRGVVYQINPADHRVRVLYDSDQEEITALLYGAGGDLFAASTSANAAGQQLQAGLSLKKAPGSPDGTSSKRPSPTSGLNLKTPNSGDPKTTTPPATQQPPKFAGSKSAGHIYKISAEGFVNEIFVEPAVFYSLLEKDGKILLGVGPKAKLYSIDPKTEQRAIVYENKNSAQVTAMVIDGKNVYAALSNPSAVVRIRQGYQLQGIYNSELLDAGQPSRWAQIQLEAQIPGSTEVFVATRSGNINEPNDATFSPWTADVKATGPVEAACPVGRYMQYRLTLKTTDEQTTPVIQEITASQMVPNSEPKVLMVAAQNTDKQKPYMLSIQTKATDDNKDQLEYTIEFRKQDRQRWILLKDKLEQPKFDWDTRTVEDGRYEIRVTAGDRLSNTEQTALSGYRISDPITIDNTPPTVSDPKMQIEGKTATLTFAVADEWSVIGKIQYTIDSDTAWKSALPEDGIYDSTKESFKIVVPDMTQGEHVIAVCVGDDVDNKIYKSYTATIMVP